MTPPTVHPSAEVGSKTVGTGTRIWQFVVVLPNAKIGEYCNICSHCLIENDVVIGNRVTIKSGVQLWDGLRVGDNVFIGPNVTFTNDKYPKSRNTSYNMQTTLIEADVSIGGGATILPGIAIGKGAIVGAGAVVTKDVLPGTTVVGNPARVINNPSSKAEYEA